MGVSHLLEGDGGDLGYPRGLSAESCDNMEDLCHSLVLNLGNIKSHCLYHRNDPQNKQDELWHVVVFSSGSIIFGFQEPSFVLKCPALGSISEERS